MHTNKASIGFSRSFSPMPVGTGTGYDEILSNSDLRTILTKNYSCTQAIILLTLVFIKTSQSN